MLHHFRDIATLDTTCYDQPHYFPRGASDARVLAVVVCLSVCHTPVLYQNG